MNLKNDFKAFSIGNNANVPSQINYEASENINNGFQADKAITIHDLNKALRQSSTIASVVADFIKTQSGENVLDDGDIAKITVQLNRALEKIVTEKIPSATLTQKGIVQLTNEISNNDTLAVTPKLVQERIDSLSKNINEKVPNTRKINGKELTGDININAEDVGAISTDNVIHSMAHGHLDKLENLRNGCSGFNPSAPFLTQYGLPRGNGGVQLRISNMSGESSEGEDDVWSHRLIFTHFGDTYRTDHINEYYKLTRKFWDNINAKPDFNGYLKISSPIIEIYPDGTFSTNEESAGAEVTKEGIGIYRVSNISGYNTDGAWGVHGGISVPQNNNNLELIFVGEHIQPDGPIIIEVYHRQHAHLPEKFQNWRLKFVDDNGKQVFYQDGEPCDIPENCRLDIRVQMPEDSLWNLKRKKLREEIESASVSDKIL